MTATDSRHAQPRAWKRAVCWLVAVGLHPRANTTTLRVAEDLAARMDFVEGLVLYDLDGTAARLDLDRSTVKRHVAVLRQLGALAWVRHGTKRNLHLPGRPYAGTATIYAATIPSVYDTAMGHQLDGEGFRARVTGYTPEGRTDAIEEARRDASARAPRSGRARRFTTRPVDNSPVDNSASQARAPHSLSRSPHGPVQVDGEKKDTPHAERPQIPSRTKNTTSSTKGRPAGARRSPLQVARDIQTARQVRPLVNWVQGTPLRKSAFALRPLIDQGLDVQRIVLRLDDWAYGWKPGWRPTNVPALIAARIRRDTEEAARSAAAAEEARREEAARAAAPHPMDNPEWRAWVEASRPAAPAPQDDGLEADVQPTDLDLAMIRQDAIRDLDLVRARIDLAGVDDARAFYGDSLVERALFPRF
ncbi:conserved hypothetical protein [Streptomyces sp. SPB78]|uniref:hypothetical protein n=1 Tax=Streptomyces sp. (strain SPB78) TaxID=591157 RepID=UPI0001B54315|nr:hypothetical protein [Streptomyces sp. SPB78]EFK98209.1 conserved hypothetical protein [Streptomyces sp. SPB78]